MLSCLTVRLRARTNQTALMGHSWWLVNLKRNICHMLVTIIQRMKVDNLFWKKFKEIQDRRTWLKCPWSGQLNPPGIADFVQLWPVQKCKGIRTGVAWEQSAVPLLLCSPTTLPGSFLPFCDLPKLPGTHAEITSSACTDNNLIVF